MDKKKIVIRTGIGFFLCIMLVLAIIFLLASTVPPGYRRLSMTKVAREKAADRLVKRLFDIYNNYQVAGPFDHKINERELNEYLASLEEIAYNRLPRKGEPAKKTGGVHEAMDKAGIGNPVVRLSDRNGGTMTVMVKSDKLRKIVCLDLSFTIPDDSPNHVKVNLDAVRIGRMPVPYFIVEKGLEALRGNLPDVAREEHSDSSGVFNLSGDFESLLVNVIKGIDSRPLPTRQTIGDHSKRIHRIKITENEMIIQFAPISDDTN